MSSAIFSAVEIERRHDEVYFQKYVAYLEKERRDLRLSRQDYKRRLEVATLDAEALASEVQAL